MTITYRDVFRVTEFRAVFTNHALGVAANTMQMLGLSALVYARTGSPLLSAIAYLAGFLPHAIGGLSLLSFADRLPPRALLVGWSLAGAAVACAIAPGQLPVWAALALVVAVGITTPVAEAGKLALLADVLPDNAYVLARSTLNAAVGVMQIVGFAVGGSLLALISPSGTLWCTALLYVAGALVLRLRLAARPARTAGRASVATTWQGTRALLAVPAIRALLLAQWLPSGLIVGVEALFVSYAGSSAGALLVAAAAGMLAGDVVVGRVLTPRGRALAMMPLMVLLAVPYLVFALTPTVAMASALAAVASFGYGHHLALQERYLAAVPEEARGQAFGLANSGMMTTQGLAATGLGVVAQQAGPSGAIALGAAVALVAGLVLAPFLRRRSAAGLDCPPIGGG
ncbi:MULTISPECIES: MFS transporter [unclassified Nonomuraea]|uniref:MFS transporter n=1 Tax=unclassified Nonomuraea TaxID=2593643 RepID=UPI0035C1123B